MIIDRRTTPLGEIALRSSGKDLEIILNGVFIMSSANGGSEAALAREALSRVSPAAALRPHGVKVLVGGLGMGYTLRAVLDYPGVSSVVVAEIQPAVIEWNRLYFGDLNRNATADARCRLVCSDVLDVVSAGRDVFDAIILDTDNGPDWLVLDGNARIYSTGGVRGFRRGLTRGGCLAVWSAEESPALERRMQEEFGSVEHVERPSLRPGSPDHIYLSVNS